MNNLKRPKFTREQEDWICYAIEEWYLHWKDKMTANNELHRLGHAKEDLKILLCVFFEDDEGINTNE